jgi:drug/metabolite transporter (DMT)-like permease
LHGGELSAELLEQLLQNGQWLMLLAALSMAIGTVMVRYVCRYVDPVVATGWHMILGGLPLLGLSGLWESEQWVNLQGGDWLSLAYSTVFGSAIAYALFFFFAATGNLTSLSSLTFLTPIFALLFSNLFLAETLDPLQWFGVGLTLISIYLINQREQLLERFRKVPKALATVEVESDS